MATSGLPAPSPMNDALPQDSLQNKLACTYCAKTGDELLRCSKCKRACYCSKLCQQKDWQSHKPSCNGSTATPTDTDDLTLLKRNMELFMKALQCPTFTKILQACFILHFDLLRFPRTERPFIGQIALGNEPVDMQDFVKIFKRERLGNAQIMGMAQVNGFITYTAAEAARISGIKKHLWEVGRAGLLAKDHTGLSVGIVQLMHGEKGQAVAAAMVIEKSALEFVRKSPTLKFNCPTTGKVLREVPLSIEACMEYLNTRIREDLNNEMGLRTEMLPYDIKVIRDANARRADSDSVATIILRGKMAREQIYRPLIHWTVADYPRPRSEPEVGKQA
ncbi:hypothetical protein B0H13DRAFT_2545793 [Mycena leptocephala]|nr:hypothetical protein B0H13DRAFT_2545793 [Mycena leptocephala]